MKVHVFHSLLVALMAIASPLTAGAAEEESGADEARSEEGAQGEEKAPPPANWTPAGEIVPPESGAKGDKWIIPSPMIEYGAFRLDVHGRIQALAGLVGEDANTANGDILSRDGFRVRRARLGLAGQLVEHWHYDLELDLIDEDNGGNALLDANIKWAPADYAWIKVGAFKPAFSRTLITSSGDMQFMERPLWVNLERATGSHMLDLGHQVGLAAGGQVSLFFYEVGVYNGSPGFSKGDMNDGLLYLVRVGAGMGEMGRSEADLTRGDFRWRVGLNGYLNHAAAAEYRGAGADLSIKVAGLAFYAEALWAKGIPNAASDDVTPVLDEVERWGMVAQAGYLLPLDFIDLELAVRFAMMDDQVHVDDEGDAWELTAGANLYLYGDHLKLMLNYVKREEMKGADMSNDMVAAMMQLKF